MPQIRTPYSWLYLRVVTWLIAVLMCGMLVPDAQAQQIYIVSSDSLSGRYDGDRLLGQWRFHPGDAPRFADPSFPDSTWDTVNPILSADEQLPAWDGLGWFRFHFQVDSLLTGMPLGLRLEQRGASEVYLDGALLYEIGVVGATAPETIPQLQRSYHVFTVDKGPHVLAVRYANYQSQASWDQDAFAGFYAVIVARPNAGIADHLAQIRTYSAFKWFSMGIFGAFALLHIILFAFYPQAIENLYFAILLVFCAAISYYYHAFVLTTDPQFYVNGRSSIQVVGVFAGLTSLLFIYQIFYEKRPRIFYIALLLGGVAMVSVWLININQLGAGLIYLLMACAEMLRVVIVAVYRRKPGAWIIGIGVAAFALSFMFIMVVDSGMFDLSSPVWGEMPFFGIFVLSASMSVYLSRNIAQTNQKLRRQIVRVRELSEEKTRQEVERNLLEAEYAQKLQELEEARQLQLSMLPDEVPIHAELELAVYMETATEVGGDYYDFAVAADGTLTIAVGDATGHGMKAGTMVTATKSLFSAFGSSSDLLPFFRQSTRALKQMNLRQLYMALTIARYHDGMLHLATAGMPSTLIWRAATGEVERVVLKGMPLGSFLDFPYRDVSVPLAHGDTVLFMSDGFPELFNAEKEMLGYEAAVDAFADVAHGSPKQIISNLVLHAQAWAGNRPPDDDVTFVVVKRRNRPDAARETVAFE